LRRTSILVSFGLLVSSIVTATASLAVFVSRSHEPAAATGFDHPYDSRMVELINQQRTLLGLALLQPNGDLAEAADAHNQWMTTHQCFTHQCEGEPSVKERIGAAGYQYWLVSEVIGMNQQTPEEIVAAWMGSPDHRGLLLSTVLKDIGCGYQESAWARVWTCDLGVLPPSLWTSAAPTLVNTPITPPTSTTVIPPTNTLVPTSVPTRTPTSVPPRTPTAVATQTTNSISGNGSTGGSLTVASPTPTSGSNGLHRGWENQLNRDNVKSSQSNGISKSR
jgi:hypothetical protein